jgi:hypothetical protein
MRLVLAAFLCCLVACNSGDKLPSGILPKPKMQAVLWDMIRADELVSYKASMDTSVKVLAASASLYQSVFQLHHITEKQFKESFRYYETHPKLFRPVLDSLSRKASHVITAPASY